MTNAHESLRWPAPKVIRLEPYLSLGTLYGPINSEDPELAALFASTATDMFGDAIGNLGTLIIATNTAEGSQEPSGRRLVTNYSMSPIRQKGKPNIGVPKLIDYVRRRAKKLWGDPDNPGLYLQGFLDVAIMTHHNIAPRTRTKQDSDSDGNVIHLAGRHASASGTGDMRTEEKIVGSRLWYLVGHLIIYDEPPPEDPEGNGKELYTNWPPIEKLGRAA